MLSLVSRLAMALVASLTMTVFIAVMVGWGFQQAGHVASPRVLYWILFPTTFLLSATVLEYLEDGNISRSLTVSLFYTGVAAALVVVLYTVAAVALPRPRHVRYHQRPLGWERPVFANGNSIFADGYLIGRRRPRQLKLRFGAQGAGSTA
jgi:hypothetical protein